MLGVGCASLRFAATRLESLEPFMSDALGGVGCDPAGVVQNVAIVEGQKGVEVHRPIGHRHLLATFGLILGEVEEHRDDAIEFGDLVRSQVVLGRIDIALADLAPFQFVRPILGEAGSARATMSSPAVLPVTACSILFWTVAKKSCALSERPS